MKQKLITKIHKALLSLHIQFRSDWIKVNQFLTNLK